jgi:hypothetical protein
MVWGDGAVGRRRLVGDCRGCGVESLIGQGRGGVGTAREQLVVSFRGFALRRFFSGSPPFPISVRLPPSSIPLPSSDSCLLTVGLHSTLLRCLQPARSGGSSRERNSKISLPPQLRLHFNATASSRLSLSPASSSFLSSVDLPFTRSGRERGQVRVQQSRARDSVVESMTSLDGAH